MRLRVIPPDFTLNRQAKENSMSSEPDSEADDYESIKVHATPERDNPKYGAVTIVLDHGQTGYTIRMTTEDARRLHSALTEYLNSETST